MASIQALAPSVAEELRASLVINSLEQCAAELIQNSLDANASMIEVKVDITVHNLQVSDNGDGISPIDMGRVGGKYTTSKCSTLQDLERIKTYGFRGEAIAAIAEMSLLDIVSFPRDQSYVYSAIFKGGERVYYGRSSKHPRFSHGTTVSVRDLFYKFPVRQRYWSEASGTKLDNGLEKVKRVVESLAIINPSVSFTLTDMTKDSKIISYRKTDSLLNRVTSVFGQVISSSLTFVKSYDDDSYSFNGYISTVGHYNRLYQHVLLNNRPINDERLNRAIIQLFQQSSFSKDSVNFDDLKRSRERYPVYVLVLRCSPELYDICVDPSKTTVEFKDEDHVLFVIRETIISFLERHHFLSRTSVNTLRDQFTTRKRKSRAKPPIGGAELDHPSHIKSSRPSNTARPVRNSHTNEVDNIEDDLHIEDEIEFVLDEDWIASMLDDDDFGSEVEYRVNEKGLMLPSTMNSRKSLSHAVNSHLKPSDTRTSGIWAQDALRKWVNPVFPIPPNHIPALNPTNAFSSLHQFNSERSPMKNISHFFSTGASEHGGFDVKNIRISKLSLQHAKVISQIDQKFILCSITLHLQAEDDNAPANTTVLAVIDQHAADERVRVERIMKEICLCNSSTAFTGPETPFGCIGNLVHQIDTTDLTPPIPITLTKREWNLASQYNEWLNRWGIALKRSPLENNLNDRDQMQNLSDDENMSELDTIHASHHFSEKGENSSSNGLTASSAADSNSSQRRPQAAQDPTFPDPTPSDLAFQRNTCETRSAQKSGYYKGFVISLPRVIADRCVVDTTLTQDLIKDSLSWAEENKFSNKGSEMEGAGISEESNIWLRCVRGCPRGILDIINSKACRGAIMFNDELSIPECYEIVQNLAKCSFPFQCAHGRPSVVPVAVLDKKASSPSFPNGQHLEVNKQGEKGPHRFVSMRNSRSDEVAYNSSYLYGEGSKWKSWLRS